MRKLFGEQVKRTKRTDKKKEKRSFRYADKGVENKAAEEKTVS